MSDKAETTRIAQCHCGQVRITCMGEPAMVAMCSCMLCQRRTGSFFNIGAWFPEERVAIQGETKPFTRTTGDAGIEATFNFCPNCGTSIWWAGVGGFGRGQIGIAGGCFADADFPVPTFSVYEEHLHGWITPPEGIPRFEKMVPIGKRRRE